MSKMKIYSPPDIIHKGVNVTRTKLPPLSAYMKYLRKVWKSNWVTNRGELSVQLESELEKYLHVKNLLVVSNGTIAIQIAFRALSLKGEVITTPFTFPATTNALIWEGLTPVFADIDSESFNIDPQEVEEKITKKTSAILAVHVYGNPCNHQVLQKIARKYGLKLIYDAAHAFGVEYKNKPVLSWGDASTLSFHATKTFHTIEGGAVITKQKGAYDRVSLLRNHGIKYYERVVMAGTNAKMNEFQAAMGLCNLSIIDKEMQKRKKIYKRYVSAFSELDAIKLQKLNPHITKFNYPYFPIVFSNETLREKIYKALFKEGIFARKYFYPPMHELPYIKLSAKDLPVATDVSHRVLCLPLYGDLSIREVKRIISIVQGMLG